MKFTRLWIIITAVALIGIYVTVWIDESTKADFPTGEGARPAEWAMLPFWALYLIATHLLAPWDIMTRRGARVSSDIEAGRMVVYPWWSWLFLGPYLLGDRRAKVPTPASTVLIWILCVLCAWLFLIISILSVVGIYGSTHHKAWPDDAHSTGPESKETANSRKLSEWLILFSLGEGRVALVLCL